jgi:hypothetical protein
MAHYSTVTSLFLVHQSNGEQLLSCGVDKRVRAWGYRGEYYGTLRQVKWTLELIFYYVSQAPHGGTWNFPLDEEYLKKEEERIVVQFDGINRFLILLRKMCYHL